MTREEAAIREAAGDGAEVAEIPPGPSEYVDPRWPADVAAIRPQRGSHVDDSKTAWFKTTNYFNEERLFPRFRREEVPTRQRHRSERVKLGPTVERNDGQGNCWTECQLVEKKWKSRYWLVTQYQEIWRINQTLEAYYNAVTGEKPTHAGTVLGVGALPGVAGATGVVGTAATASGVAGLGLACFVSTTYIMRGIIKDAWRISAGWRLSELSGYEPESLEAESTPFWDRCSEIHPCGQPAVTETPAPAAPAASDATAPKPLRPTTEAGTPNTPSQEYKNDALQGLRETDHWIGNPFLWDGGPSDVTPIEEGPGEYTDPQWPEGAVQLHGVPGETDDWVVETRLYPRFVKEIVPARAMRRTEHRKLGPEREASDGKGLCWRECQVQDLTYLKRYWLAEQYQEVWRINVNLKWWYDWVTGAATTHSGTAGTIASSGTDKSLAQGVGESVMRYGFGFGRQPGGGGAITAVGEAIGVGAKGVAVVGAILSGFVSLAYVMRRQVQDEHLISATWVPAPDYSGYDEEAIEKESTPYWERCSEPHECEPHAPVLKGRGGWMRRKRGKVDRRLAGAAAATGVLTLLLVAFGVTAGGSESPAAAPAAAPTPTATASPSPTLASPTTGLGGSSSPLASPAPGSPIFTAFNGGLTGITISGGFAPPPGTHPSHTSVFAISASGGDLAANWKLDNPICGALFGAERHSGQVSWPHSGCSALETSARMSVLVAAKADFLPDWTVRPGAPYFIYSQNARAGDAPETAGLAKAEQLQYFGPAPAKTATIAQQSASPGTASGRGPAPWVPFVAVVGIAACAALCWRSGLFGVAY